MPETVKPPGLVRWILKFSRELVKGMQRLVDDPDLLQATRRELNLPATSATVDRAAVNGKLADLDGKLSELDRDDGDELFLDERTVELLLGGKRFVELMEVLAPGKAADDPRTYGDITYAFATIFASEWFLRPRAPWAYALVRLLMLGYEKSEDIPRFDPFHIFDRLTNKATRTADDGFGGTEALGGLVVPPVVILLNWLISKVNDDESLHMKGLKKGDPYFAGQVGFKLGWDPGPDVPAELQQLLARAMSLGFTGKLKLYEVDTEFGLSFLTTAVAVGEAEGGPGFVLRLGGAADLKLELPSGGGGAIKRELGFKATGGPGADFLWNTKTGDVSSLGALEGDPTVELAVESKGTEEIPAFRIGKGGKSRLDIRGIKYGLTVGVRDQFGYLELKGGELVLNMGDLLPGEVGKFFAGVGADKIGGRIDAKLKLDAKKGLVFEGEAALKIRLASNAGVKGSVFGEPAGIRFDYLDLELGPGAGGISLGLATAARFNLGPFAASIDRTGFAAVFAQKGGALEVREEFKPPKGIGLRLDLGAVKGGGFLLLDYEKGEFAGAFELTFLAFSIQAIVILNTKVPGDMGWALFILGYVRWPGGIELGFGIKLNAIGGMIGVQHGFNLYALEHALPSGAMDDVLFPADVTGDAPRIINSLSTIFPIQRGALTVGFMMELGWGSDYLCSLRVGLILPFENVFERVNGSARLASIVLLGRIEVTAFKAVPKPIRVQIIGDFVAEVGFDPFSLRFYARLRDSRIGPTTLEGAVVVSFVTGSNARFILAAGGFHPSYSRQVPCDLPAPIDRLAVTYDIGLVKTWIRAYFAIAPGSVQFGAQAGIRYVFGPISLGGEFGFDALIQLPPDFRFEAAIYGSVGVKFRGHTLLGISLRLELSGPRRWRAKGTGEFSILFWDVSIDFDESWGSEDHLEQVRTNVAALVQEDLKERTNWRLELPAGAASLVTLAGVEAVAEEMLAHPLSTLSFIQARVPFGLELQRYGSAQVEGTTLFPVPQVTDEADRAFGTPVVLTEQFAVGEYLNLSDDERLSRPGFQPFAAGIASGGEQYLVPADAKEDAPLEFEEAFQDTQDRGIVTLQAFDRAALGRYAAREAAGRSELRWSSKLADRTVEPVTTKAPSWVAVTADELAADDASATPAWATGSPALVSALHDAPGRRLLVVEDFELVP